MRSDRPSSADQGGGAAVVVSLRDAIEGPNGPTHTIKAKSGSKISVEPMFKVLEALKIIDESGHLYMIATSNILSIYCGKVQGGPNVG